MDLTDGAVTLFAYDDFRNSLVLCLRIVDFIPVDKKNQIRILFDGPGFT